jgi:hypothetical protein
MPVPVGEQNSSKLSPEVKAKLETLQATLGPQTLTEALGTPAAERTLETALTNNDSQTIQGLRRYVELSRLPLTDAQEGLMAGARLQLENENNSGFQEGVAAVSAFNSEVFRSATEGMSVNMQMKFAQFWVDNVNFDNYAQLSYDRQLQTASQVLNSFNTQEGTGWAQTQITNIAAAMVTTIAGELRGADLKTMQEVWAARNMDELRAAATYLSFAEGNALTAFVESSDAGSASDAATVAAEQVILGMLDILRQDQELSKDQKEKLDKIIEEEEEKKEEEKERREEHD